MEDPLAAPPVVAPRDPGGLRSPLISRHRANPVAQEIWRDTIAGRYKDALYLTIMSRDSFESLVEILPKDPPAARRLRVLTLDPGISRGAIEALRCHLGEHTDQPEATIRQVREAAVQWQRLSRDSKYSGFLQIRAYSSSPTLQGVLIPDELILVELLPYSTAKQDRPALLIRREEDEENYTIFAKAFEGMWQQSSLLLCEETIDGNSQYTQIYHELRRYRDFELSAAVWVTAIQIGLATLIWRDPAGAAKLFGESRVAQFLIGALVYLIGLFGIFAVCYSKCRYEQLVKAVRVRFREAYEWPGLPISTRFGQPFYWIISILGLLPMAHLFILGLALHWLAATQITCLIFAILPVFLGRWLIGRFGFVAPSANRRLDPDQRSLLR